jgi:hypothetical protein
MSNGTMGEKTQGLLYDFLYLSITWQIFLPGSIVFNSTTETTNHFMNSEELTMLKIVKTSIAIAAASFIITGTAHADVNEALQNICTIVKADDKGELRKKMKRVQSDYRLKLRDYYSGISCSGNSLIRTAMLNGSVETGTLLIKKMSKGDLNSPEQDGKTVMIWASENGMDSSPLVAALNDRI